MYVHKIGIEEYKQPERKIFLIWLIVINFQICLSHYFQLSITDLTKIIWMNLISSTWWVEPV